MRCGLVFAAVFAAVGANNQQYYDLNSLYPPTHRPDPPKYEPENPKQPDYPVQPKPDYPPQPRGPDYPDLEEIESTYEEPHKYPELPKPVPSIPALPVASPAITVTNMNNVRTNMFCSSMDSAVIASNPTLRAMCNQQNSAFIGGATQLDLARMPRNSAGAAALNAALGLNLAAGLAGNANAGSAAAAAGLNQGITVTNMNNVATNMFCSRMSVADFAVNPTLAIMCNQVGSAAIAGATQVREERNFNYPQPEYPQYPQPEYPLPVDPVYPTPAYPEVYPTHAAPALYPLPAAVASPPITVTNMNNVATNMFCSTMTVEQLTANPTLASMCNQAFSAAISGAAQIDDRIPRNFDPYNLYPTPVPAVKPVVPAVSPPITVTNMNNVYTNMYCSSMAAAGQTNNPMWQSMCNQLGSAAIRGATQIN